MRKHIRDNIAKSKWDPSAYAADAETFRNERGFKFTNVSTIFITDQVMTYKGENKDKKYLCKFKKSATRYKCDRVTQGVWTCQGEGNFVAYHDPNGPGHYFRQYDQPAKLDFEYFDNY